MFTFLADLPGLPEDQRADSGMLTSVGRRQDTAGLSPLQLSVKLGNLAMFKHILRRQTVVLWKWCVAVRPSCLHALGEPSALPAQPARRVARSCLAVLPARRSRRLLLVPSSDPWVVRGALAGGRSRST
eukprot:2615083-Prymnesium_polylepis.1